LLFVLGALLDDASSFTVGAHLHLGSINPLPLGNNARTAETMRGTPDGTDDGTRRKNVRK
jgi:hypothetical protein